MKNNYIIINADTIQKRIEELKTALQILQDKGIKNQERIEEANFRIAELEEILLQSIPLDVELKKVYTEGNNRGYGYDNTLTVEQYIENLKLDI